MTPGWVWDPERTRKLLMSLGFDVDVSDVRQDAGSLVARRDRAERSQVIAVDSGGRFRATVTVVLDEAVRTEHVAGVPTRVVTETVRSVTLTGLLSEAGQLASLVSEIEALAPARVRGDDQPPNAPIST